MGQTSIERERKRQTDKEAKTGIKTRDERERQTDGGIRLDFIRFRSVSLSLCLFFYLVLING